jgi:hypothetical protein
MHSSDEETSDTEEEVQKRTSHSDLYDYVDLESQEKELNCVVCELPCLKPLIMGCCGKYICSGCLDIDNICPGCEKRCTIDNIFPLDPVRDFAVRSIMSRVRVVCKSCQRITKRGIDGELFDDHYQNYCSIRCSHGCGATLTRAHQQKHNNECGYANIKCDANDVGCSMIIKRMNILDHQLTCPYFRIAPQLRQQQKTVNQLEEIIIDRTDKSRSKIEDLESRVTQLNSFLFEQSGRISTEERRRAIQIEIVDSATKNQQKQITSLRETTVELMSILSKPGLCQLKRFLPNGHVLLKSFRNGSSEYETINVSSNCSLYDGEKIVSVTLSCILSGGPLTGVSKYTPNKFIFKRSSSDAITTEATLSIAYDAKFAVQHTTEVTIDTDDTGSFMVKKIDDIKNSSGSHIYLVAYTVSTSLLAASQIGDKPAPSSNNESVPTGSLQPNDELVRLPEWAGLPTPNCILSNDNLTCTKNDTSSHSVFMGSKGWRSGVHEWAIRVENLTDPKTSGWAMVGVAAMTDQRGEPAKYNSNGYYIFLVSGGKYSPGGVANAQLDPPIGPCGSNGSIIKVKLDCNCRTLSFAVNNDVWRIAYTDLPYIKFYPAVEIYYPNSSITFIP